MTIAFALESFLIPAALLLRFWCSLRQVWPFPVFNDGSPRTPPRLPCASLTGAKLPPGC